MAQAATAAHRLLTGVREPVRVATTANVDLGAGGLLTIDGVALDVGDRVLVKNQTDQIENGIYTASAGRWFRASDARDSRTLAKGTLVIVESGTANGGKVFAQQTASPIIGMSSMPFGLFFSYDTVGDVQAAQAAAEAVRITLQGVIDQVPGKIDDIENAEAAATTAISTARSAAEAAIIASRNSAISSVQSAGATIISQATTLKGQAESARDKAYQYERNALAAAEATGNVVFYDTKEDAEAGVGELSNGQIVEVLIDEDHGNARTRYRVQSGALVFKRVAGIDIDDSVLPSFTGAISRRLRDKIEERASVKDFGAVGDGVTDDTEAFKDALAYCRERELFIPAGHYILSEEIKITEFGGPSYFGAIRGSGKDETTIEFINHGTEVVSKDVMPVGFSAYSRDTTEASGISGLELSDLTIIAPQYGSAIFFANSRMINISRVQFTGDDTVYCHAFITRCINVNFYACTMGRSRFAHLAFLNSARAGIQTGGTGWFNDTIVVNYCKFSSTTWTCIVDDGSSSFGSRSITNNTEGGFGKFAFYVGGIGIKPYFDQNWTEHCKWVYYFLGASARGENFPAELGDSTPILKEVSKTVIRGGFGYGATIKGHIAQNKYTFVTVDPGYGGFVYVENNMMYANVTWPVYNIRTSGYGIVEGPSNTYLDLAPGYKFWGETGNNSFHAEYLGTRTAPGSRSSSIVTNHLIAGNENTVSQHRWMNTVWRARAALANRTDYSVVFSYKFRSRVTETLKNYSGYWKVLLSFAGDPSRATGYINLEFMTQASGSGDNRLNRIRGAQITSYSLDAGSGSGFAIPVEVAVTTGADNTLNITVKGFGTGVDVGIIAEFFGAHRTATEDSEIILLTEDDAAWAPSTAYSVGNTVYNSGNVYVCTVAGTSDSSGGPTGTGTAIVDGTVQWNFSRVFHAELSSFLAYPA